MKEKSIVGDLINFRGLVYSPTNENGVIFLFGKVMEDLNMYIEEIKPGFPDCIGRRFSGKGWERVYIEFEYKSSNFRDHKHNPEHCDIIICWEHNWLNCPIEVIELKEVIKTLENTLIQRPDVSTDSGTISIKDHLKNYPEEITELFYMLDDKIKLISDEIWYKVTGQPGVTYYSPERVFIFLYLQKQGLNLVIFTNGKKIEGVTNLTHVKGGAKWGRIIIKENDQVEKVISILRISYRLIKDAIKNNIRTGWWAPLDNDERNELMQIDPCNKDKK